MQTYLILLLALSCIIVESTNLLRIPISSTSKLFEDNKQDGGNSSNFDHDSLFTIDEIGNNFQRENTSSINISCSEKCKDLFQSDFLNVTIIIMVFFIKYYFL